MNQELQQYKERQQQIKLKKLEVQKMRLEQKLLKNKKPKGVVHKTEAAVEKGVSKLLAAIMAYKPVVKSSNVAYKVDLSNPEYKDKSRFFKETWEEEKKSLFFK